MEQLWRRHGRRTRPWIPEPGLWMQWDYADGPVDSLVDRGTLVELLDSDETPSGTATG